ncbi:hypothetical protein DFQ28_008291 [Apophysomyces sp. BC1034]|nr:hypothetical protein DFQ30_007262 [Apophysomyces sp. BC1015]KAG0181898.1 hypothetical protein DFQ29_006564 [Apophysomyces sp. BC1021]KAG0192668.1 hypothetical protein DFQ28_008291 [Apophysomyces sp. BC1034]
MNRFACTINRRLLKTPTLKRGYASDVEQTLILGKAFGKLWRNVALVAAAGVVWFKVDEHITSSGEQKHPFTKWIESGMTSSDENDRVAAETLVAAGKIADYRLITQDAQRAPIYRMRYPESFERASPRALSAGLHADLSDLKVRSD